MECRKKLNAWLRSNEQGIETLARHGFDQDVFTTAAREALRCLANSLLLQPSTRRLLLDLGYLTKASTRLKVGHY